MRRDLEKLKRQTFDLLVVGGGINGSAIAHLAALRGLKTALIEKKDFASGTSSKSSKLIHGGIRYLENFQFKLVREALRERYFHVQKVPHLVRPLAFVIPVYEGDKRPLWLMKVGVFLYDLLAGARSTGPHQSMDAETVLKREPGLRREGLLGGVLYYDALMDDARLCLENVLSADQRGAACANYLEVTGFLKENGRVAGVQVQDLLEPDSSRFEIRAKRVVCCGGAWTHSLLMLDDPRAESRIRPTKGVHLVTSKKISKNALLIPSKRDNRIFFIIPWKGGTMIGTTDTDFRGNPDQVEADDSDIEYLLTETARVFPDAKLSRESVDVTFAGLRPLLKKSGNASSVSREHEVTETPSGLFFVTGGKYTTYRAVAEDFVNRLISGPGIESLFGSGTLETAEVLASKFSVSTETAAYLLEKYGSRAVDILGLVKKDSSLGKQITQGHPAIFAQIPYSVDVEMAQTVEDVLARRLTLAYSPLELKAAGQAIIQALHESGMK